MQEGYTRSARKKAGKGSDLCNFGCRPPPEQFSPVGRKSYCPFCNARANSLGTMKTARLLGNKTGARGAIAASRENRCRETRPLFIGAPTEAPRIEITFLQEESFVLAPTTNFVNRTCGPVSLVAL
jgi:hypothetical protein